MSTVTFLMILFCVAAEAGAQLNFKAASDAASPDRPVRSLLRQPVLWFGILLWAIEIVAWLGVLERAPLVIAFPVMTLTYAVTPLAAHYVLREPLTRGQLVGGACVAAGVLLVSLSDLNSAVP